jgi:hypothetical protein
MNRIVLQTFCAMALVVVLSREVNAAPPDLPSADSLQSMVDEGNYRAAIPQLDRIIALKGDAAAQYDRFHVIMLEVECRLQLHQKDALAVKIKLAKEEATTTHNIDDLGEICSLELLIKAAHGDTYVPATGDDKTKFNILDRRSRDAAAPYLYADSMSALKEEGWESKSAMSLAPLLDISERFAGIRALDHKVKKDTSETDALGTEYAGTAAKLITNYLVQCDHEIDRTVDRAQEMDRVRNGRGRSVLRQHGLGSADVTSLNAIQTSCKQIPGAIAKMTLAFAAPLPIADTAPSAGDLAQKANDTLREYPHRSDE